MKPAYKPVLCVVSSHPIKGASGVPTGFFLAELTHPLKVLEDAGIKTTIASIRGGQPPVDGFNLSDPVNAWYWNETDFQQRLATTPALSELKGADYSAVFFAGGHGTMWEFAWGWHHEAGIHLLRLMLSGAFDKYPNLQVISGHWGEMLPFWLQRLDDSLPLAATGLSRTLTRTFQEHVYVTPPYANTAALPVYLRVNGC